MDGVAATPIYSRLLLPLCKTLPLLSSEGRWPAVLLNAAECPTSRNCSHEVLFCKPPMVWQRQNCRRSRSEIPRPKRRVFFLRSRSYSFPESINALKVTNSVKQFSKQIRRAVCSLIPLSPCLNVANESNTLLDPKGVRRGMLAQKMSALGVSSLKFCCLLSPSS